MSIINAIILGIVQGVAEFLPISSSGHLAILNNLFHMTTAENGHLFFDVLLHLGTLAAVCVVYRRDIVEMFYEVISFANLGPYAGGRQAHYPAARLFALIVVGTLPLFFVLPINDQVEKLYYNDLYIGMALILTGCMLYVAEKILPGRKTEKNMLFLDALIIGICQGIATIPGLSRSGTTITAGLATGLKREFAVKYSFLLSLPAVFGANLLNLVKAFKIGFDWHLLPAYLIGTVFAFIAGVASISLIKLISKKGRFGGFAYYCWLVGVLTIILTSIF